ncbi:MAG TPA: type II toxin-antitoxin system VapC family toxin [Tepidisphaeraceae bacterium]|nr:type II toxin-antitoxin system VapC family toxin [Tepidisphaeraceae bacterium]
MGSLTTLAGDSIYLDANVFIYAVEGLPSAAAKLASLFQRIDRGDFRAFTSQLTLAEVLVKPIRSNDAAIRGPYEQMVRTAGSLTVVDVSRDVLVGAATLRAGMSIKLPDAIHASTALREGCTTFVTNDQRFVAVPNLPVLLVNDLP